MDNVLIVEVVSPAEPRKCSPYLESNADKPTARV